MGRRKWRWPCHDGECCFDKITFFLLKLFEELYPETQKSSFESTPCMQIFRRWNRIYLWRTKFGDIYQQPHLQPQSIAGKLHNLQHVTRARFLESKDTHGHHGGIASANNVWRWDARTSLLVHMNNWHLSHSSTAHGAQIMNIRATTHGILVGKMVWGSRTTLRLACKMPASSGFCWWRRWGCVWISWPWTGHSCSTSHASFSSWLRNK